MSDLLLPDMSKVFSKMFEATAAGLEGASFDMMFEEMSRLGSTMIKTISDSTTSASLLRLAETIRQAHADAFFEISDLQKLSDVLTRVWGEAQERAPEEQLAEIAPIIEPVIKGKPQRLTRDQLLVILGIIASLAMGTWANLSNNKGNTVENTQIVYETHITQETTVNIGQVNVEINSGLEVEDNVDNLVPAVEETVQQVVDSLNLVPQLPDVPQDSATDEGDE